MIHFIHHSNPAESVTLQNFDLAALFNSYISESCCDHPENISLVSINSDPVLTFNIERVCCEQFRKKIVEQLASVSLKETQKIVTDIIRDHEQHRMAVH